MERGSELPLLFVLDKCKDSKLKPFVAGYRGTNVIRKGNARAERERNQFVRMQLESGPSTWEVGLSDSRASLGKRGFDWMLVLHGRIGRDQPCQEES